MSRKSKQQTVLFYSIWTTSKCKVLLLQYTFFFFNIFFFIYIFFIVEFYFFLLQAIFCQTSGSRFADQRNSGVVVYVCVCAWVEGNVRGWQRRDQLLIYGGRLTGDREGKYFGSQARLTFL